MGFNYNKCKKICVLSQPKIISVIGMGKTLTMLWRKKILVSLQSYPNSVLLPVERQIGFSVVSAEMLNKSLKRSQFHYTGYWLSQFEILCSFLGSLRKTLSCWKGFKNLLKCWLDKSDCHIKWCWKL